MSILFFIDSLRSGGKERRLTELLCFLKETTNCECSLVLTENVIHYGYVRNLNIPIYVIKRRFFKYDPSLFFRFYRIAKEINPDIIHTWGRMATFYAIPAKLLTQKVLVSNLVADVNKTFKTFSLLNFFHQMAVKFADKVLGNSEAGLKAYGLENNKKSAVIYNGIRRERFESDLNESVIKKELGISLPFVVIMVASASKAKDYDLFLNVAKKIFQIRKDVSFCGIGDGTELNRLRQRIKDEKIGNALLLGRRNDVELLMGVSDIGVLFSNAEGVSNAILEYMGAGLPVVTTDLIGGSREVIEDGRSGYLMGKDAKAIAKRICCLLDDKVLKKKLGERGREIIVDKFSLERMGREYLNLYECILIRYRKVEQIINI